MRRITLRMKRPAPSPRPSPTRTSRACWRTQNLAERVRMVCAVDQPQEHVYYLERVFPAGNRVPFIEVSAAPLDVAPWLKQKLFDKWPTVCASATLATVGPHP